jgi:hypothetical protein
VRKERVGKAYISEKSRLDEVEDGKHTGEPGLSLDENHEADAGNLEVRAVTVPQIVGI